MNTLPDDMKRLIISHVRDDRDIAVIRSLSKEFKQLTDETVTITDRERYNTIHALIHADNELITFLRNSKVAKSEHTLLKQYRQWVGDCKKEDRVSFVFLAIRMIYFSFRRKKDQKLYEILREQDMYLASYETIYGNRLMKKIRHFIDAKIKEASLYNEGEDCVSGKVSP